MPLPHDVVQMTTAMSHLLPNIPDEERKEYLVGVMNIVYEIGLVNGKMEMLTKAIEESRRASDTRQS